MKIVITDRTLIVPRSSRFRVRRQPAISGSRRRSGGGTNEFMASAPEGRNSLAGGASHRINQDEREAPQGRHTATNGVVNSSSMSTEPHFPRLLLRYLV